MNRIKVISTEITNFVRRIKFFRMGGYDTRTANEISPYGFDSNPIKDMIGIYSDTLVNGRQVIIGYINKNQVAALGESRMFSTDDGGEVKFYVWCKNDGTLHLGGSADNLVRFSKLEQAFNDLQDKWNNFASAYSPGGPSIVGTPPTAEESSADISEAKIDEIKIA